MQHKIPLLIDADEALSFRLPLSVAEVFLTKTGNVYPICPRCNVTLDREYMYFCDRCGQMLDWHDLGLAIIRTNL